MEKEIKKKIARNWFILLQQTICNDIEKLEKNKIKFKSKTWSRSKTTNEGGGEFRILKYGKIFEKVGVNFSEVHGKFSTEMKKKIPGAKKNSNFWASGISVVMHMNNPHIPAIHFNTRFIYTTHGWFGGGIDVTPCIKDNKEKNFLHKELKKMCDRHNKKFYKKYKEWCDQYFYLSHRKETRGIGGIFFDYKKDNWANDFRFISDLGVTFQMLFNSIIDLKYKKKWSSKEKELQYIKRGRYAEFNLLYDRGTKFGLQTGGNVEAILMSLPPLAKWN
ncbi:oxygen-dependent coproporphyrinogen oxidase [Candidatus Pelagibacter sp.]|nr:oxygen-dependent coproporphyrinogen oxidase [Candidatus Pelagibacter sp.]